jgi:phage recombination protein Bet
MARRLSVDPKKLLKTLQTTVFKECRSEEEMLALVVVANEYQLNPLLREMYAFPAKGGGIVPVVGVDGWLNIINRQEKFNGLETVDNFDADGELVSCTCTIHVKDRDYPTVITEYLEECYRPTEPWKMKHRMLRHKTIMQCGRVAFGISGIYDEEDAEKFAAIQADVSDVTDDSNRPSGFPSKGKGKTTQAKSLEKKTRATEPDADEIPMDEAKPADSEPEAKPEATPKPEAKEEAPPKEEAKATPAKEESADPEEPTLAALRKKLVDEKVEPYEAVEAAKLLGFGSPESIELIPEDKMTVILEDFDTFMGVVEQVRENDAE